MRLGQLARQLETKPENIVSFLAKEKDLEIKSHPNAKVDDALIEEITTHFKPVVEVEEIETEKAELVKEEAPTPATKEEPVEKTKVPEHIETVKAAPAQELKIVGKIDLPNKKEITIEVDGVVYDQETLDNKKKEELAADREKKAAEKEVKRKEEEERKAKAREQREVEAERKAMLATEENNLLSKEEERKKQIILKAQQEREQRLEAKRKKQQAAHYAQKHAATTSVPPKKKVKKAVKKEEEKIEVQVQHAEVEKLNAFQKFIKWLNT